MQNSELAEVVEEKRIEENEELTRELFDDHAEDCGEDCGDDSSSDDEECCSNEECEELGECIQEGECPPSAKKIRDNDISYSSKVTQWELSGNNTFVAATKTINKLPVGVYSIGWNHQRGIPIFNKIKNNTEDLIPVPETYGPRIINEIEDFWNKRDVYIQRAMTYKRGILLYGPPGSGKTSINHMVIRDVIQRGGYCFQFTRPSFFTEAMRTFRHIHPNDPIVVLMEDVDSIIKTWDESEVLNILDGIECVQNSIFLATTNYPEKLGARIVNRPSRFDRRFKVGYPSPAARRVYLEHLMTQDSDANKVNLERWVGDTSDFTFAHLKELFKCVIIHDMEYEEVLADLKTMREKRISSDQDKTESPVGFATTP